LSKFQQTRWPIFSSRDWSPVILRIARYKRMNHAGVWETEESCSGEATATRGTRAAPKTRPYPGFKQAAGPAGHKDASQRARPPAITKRGSRDCGFRAVANLRNSAKGSRHQGQIAVHRVGGCLGKRPALPLCWPQLQHHKLATTPNTGRGPKPQQARRPLAPPIWR